MSNSINICPITAGYTLKMMCAWEDKIGASRRALHHAGQQFSANSFEEKHDNIPEDHMVGGLYLLANTVAEACGSVEINYGDFVFEYEHCNADDDSIWMPAVAKLSAEEWSNLTGNNVVPAWFKGEILTQLRQKDMIVEAA